MKKTREVGASKTQRISAVAVEEGTPGAIGIAEALGGVGMNSRRGAGAEPYAVGASDRPIGVGCGVVEDGAVGEGTLVAYLVVPRTVGLAVPLGLVNGKRLEGGAAGAVAIGARGGDTPVGVVVVVIRGAGAYSPRNGAKAREGAIHSTPAKVTTNVTIHPTIST